MVQGGTPCPPDLDFCVPRKKAGTVAGPTHSRKSKLLIFCYMFDVPVIEISNLDIVCYLVFGILSIMYPTLIYRANKME